MAAHVDSALERLSQKKSNLTDGYSTMDGTAESQSINGHRTSNNNEINHKHNPSTTSFTNSEQIPVAPQSSHGLADFFSQEVFQIVLHNPTTAHRLLKFSQARMCGENMEFLEKVCLDPSTAVSLF